MSQDKSIPFISVVEDVETADTKAPKVGLEDRETDEMIIAMVGPVASGVTTTCDLLKEYLEIEFGYKVERIGVSEVIEEACALLDVKIEPYESDVKRIEFLQKQGSALRKKFGEEYLANKCVERIAVHRTTSGGVQEVDGTNVPIPTRQAYIIDSLKHPSEVVRLQEVYGDTFWVFGIFAPEDVRIERLSDKDITETAAIRIIEIDEDEGPEFGQKVRDTIQASDFFLRNDASNKGQLRESVSRYLKIIFGTEIITPRPDETAMYNAAAAAAGSACLSRQVGAAIYSDSGELIGKGRNDVPKYGGGLYGYDDGDCDHRCYKWKDTKCYNDAHKEKLYEGIFKALKENGLLTEKKSKGYSDVQEALKATDINNLIEFSRAVHAEMDALISVARGARSGLVGGTLYCTTYPCHSCARHIVASGITRVLYIEPYPKSKAPTLHKDSISSKSSEKERVRFLQYQGVAPKNMLRLFRNRGERKENGLARTYNPKRARPISRSPLDGFHTREQIVVDALHKVEHPTE